MPIATLKEEIERELKNKADIVMLQAADDTKVDEEYNERILERITKMEEINVYNNSSVNID